VPRLGSRYAALRQQMGDARLAARQYTRDHGVDIPDVADWVWPDAADSGTTSGSDAQRAATDTGADNV